MRLFSAATASRVSVPRSPPPPRHESGFLPRRTEEPSSSSPHLGSTPARAALAPSEDAPALGAAGSAEGRWLLGIDAPFCAAQLQLPCGPLAFRRPRASQPGRYCSCLQLTNCLSSSLERERLQSVVTWREAVARPSK